MATKVLDNKALEQVGQKLDASSISASTLRGIKPDVKTEKSSGSLRAQKTAQRLQNGQQPRGNRTHIQSHNLEDVRTENLNFRMGTNLLNFQSKGKGTIAVKPGEDENSFIPPDVDEATAVAMRLQAVEQVESIPDTLEDLTSLEQEGVENALSKDFRTVTNYGALDNSPSLALMLENVVDLSQYLQDRTDRETRGKDAAEQGQAQILDFDLLKRKKKGLAEKEDVETLTLVQYLPILYDTINYIVEKIKTKDLGNDVLTKMESLKGELAQLVRAAADESSPINELFKEIKKELDDRDKIEWDAA